MFYQKYRPRFFREVVGQDLVIKVLKNFLIKNYIPHGYLFAGERGTGKTTIARIYANALNCLNPQNGEPCGQCRVCQLIKENKFLDIVELDAASHRKIENIRNIQEHIGFKPIQGKYKVFILDEAHSLTEEASNALLKTLEEPPKHAIFILATTEPERILTTIHSRVQRLDFKRLTPHQIVQKLKFIAENEKIDYQESALYLIAEESQGSLRDAETLFEKIALAHNPSKITEEVVAEFLGQLNPNRILEFLNLIAEKKREESFNYLHKIYSDGFDLNLFLKSLLRTLRQLIFLKLQPNFFKHLVQERSEEVANKMKKISEKFKIEELKKLSHLFFEADLILKKDPPHPLFALELTLLEYFA